MALSTRGIHNQLPTYLSDLLQRLSETGRSFIGLYEKNEHKMQDIVHKLGKISEKVKDMQKEATLARLVGATLGGLGIVLGVAALAASAGQLAALGCTAALAGGTAVAAVNVHKAMEEKTSIETVEKLGTEFMKITKQPRTVLEEIHEVSEEIDEKSSSLMTRTGVQAKRGLSKTKQLELLLRQTKELSKKSRDVMEVTLTMQNGVRELLNFIMRITPTCAEDEQFRDCIANSASQCETTLSDLAEMRSMLKDFEEM